MLGVFLVLVGYFYGQDLYGWDPLVFLLLPLRLLLNPYNTFLFLFYPNVLNIFTLQINSTALFLFASVSVITMVVADFLCFLGDYHIGKNILGRNEHIEILLQVL